MKRTPAIGAWLLVSGFLVASATGVSKTGASEPAPAYQIRLETVSRGYDGKTCWVHPRAGILPARGEGRPPTVVLTMQRLLLTGSDVFFPLHDLHSTDLGRTWTAPREHADTLGRRAEADGVIVAACDFWPKWHAASGKLLGIGHSVRYRDNKVLEVRRRETVWSVYQPESGTWTKWTELAMPQEPRFFNAGAGCVQRLDLPDGQILLPIYAKGREDRQFQTSVLRCAFDGQQLQFVEQGNELTVPEGRGLYEPSLTRFRNRFYLTLRNDSAGYVAASDDGLHFSAPQRWLWDDGTDLGNYNTQQHWVTHSDGLFLVYTRRGANNDHVFRHRAPLFMAQVEPTTLRVIRATERVLIPERGARLGNFGVTVVSPTETWVTVAEWMQTWGPRIIIPPDNPRGADNSVYAARILWEQPNASWNQL